MGKNKIEKEFFDITIRPTNMFKSINLDVESN